MGYYSEVAFAIRGKKEDVIPVLVTYRNKGLIAKDALDECTYHEAAGIVTILYHNESTKWYDDFDEVKALKDLYDLFSNIDDDPERDEKFEGKFIRIGEETEDVHENEFGAEPWDMLGYSRLIDINVSNMPGDTLEKLCATPTPTSPTSSPS